MKITVKDLRSLVRQTLSEQASPEQIQTGLPPGLKGKIKAAGYRFFKRDVTLPVFGQDFQIMASAESEWSKASPVVKDFIVLLAFLSRQEHGSDAKKYVVVTDLHRDAKDQVRVMYDKLKAGDSAEEVRSLYSSSSPGMTGKTQDISTRVIKVLEEKGDAGVPAAIAIIEDAMKEGNPLSAHLHGDAVDLRSIGIKNEVEDLLAAAVELADIDVIDETDAKEGPHWHVTVNDIKPEGRRLLQILKDIKDGVPYKPGKDDPR
jgi:hypothetical protein